MSVQQDELKRKLICPFFSARMGTMCLKSECGVYDVVAGCCAFVSIANALRKEETIGENDEDIGILDLEKGRR